MRAESDSQEIRRQFIFLANELCNRFPDLDLRFNLQQGSGTLRVVVADAPRKVMEFSLGKNSPERVLYDATFAVKEIARIFDA